MIGSWRKIDDDHLNNIAASFDDSDLGEETSDIHRRWNSRKEAVNAIKTFVAEQGHIAMLDKKNKGGSAVVFKCVSAIKGGSDCPMCIRLRKSKKIGDWYIAGKIILEHTCTSQGHHSDSECYPLNSFYHF